MMPQTLMRIAEPSDYPKWEKFLLDSPNAHVLQSIIMAQVFKEISFSPLLILAEREGKIVGGLMSYEWFSGSNIPVTKFFARLYSYYGPVFLDGTDKTLVKEFLHYANAVVEKKYVMDHRFSTIYQEIEDSLMLLGYTPEPYTPRYKFKVNLSKSREELWKGLEKRCRGAIKKAEKKGVVIKEAGEEAPKLFHLLHLDTTRRLGIYPDPYSFIKSIWRTLPKRHARFFFAYYQNEPIAGVIALYYTDHVYYYMSASLKDHWNLSPNNSLLWHIMLDGKDRGFKVFDLMSCPGEDEKDNPEYGLYLYKRSFGGSLIYVGATYRKIFSPFATSLWDNILVPCFKKLTFISRYL